MEQEKHREEQQQQKQQQQQRALEELEEDVGDSDMRCLNLGRVREAEGHPRTFSRESSGFSQVMGEEDRYCAKLSGVADRPRKSVRPLTLRTFSITGSI